MQPSSILGMCTAASSVGAALLRESLFSIIIASLVWAVLRLWPQAPPQWRMMLWSLVLLRLVLPTSLTHPLTVRAALERIKAASSLPASGTTDRQAVTLSRDQEEAHDRAPSPLSTHPPLGPALTAVWLAGAVLSSATFLRRYLVHRRAVAVGKALPDSHVSVLAAEWRHRLGVKREVRLVAISSAGPPFTVGVWHPVIAIPDRILADNRSDVLETVVAHEMAHIRRLDELSLFVVRGLQAIYFFNPVAWLAGMQIGLARECLCDSMVLAHRTVSPARYGRGLLAVLESCLCPPPGAVLTLGHTANQWKARLSSLRHRQAISRTERLTIACTLVAACVLVLPMAATPVTPSPAEPLSASSEGLAPAGPPAAGVPMPPSLPVVTFRNPVPGSTVTSGFGPRINPVSGKEEHHSGIDLAAPRGTPVLAAASGIVTKVAAKKGQGAEDGVAIRIAHTQTLESFYAFVEHPLVREGESVAAGQHIGSVGTPTGGPGPHLHFQINERGRPIDPRSHLE